MQELYAFVVQQLSHNPFLTGGIGTVLIGGVVYQLRAIPSRIWTLVKANIISEFTIIDSNCPYYDEIVAYYTKYNLPKFSRQYSVSDDGKLIIGYGRGIGIYKGTFLISYRNLLDNKMNSDEQFSLTFFTRNRETIANFVQEAVNTKSENLVKIVNYAFGHYNGSIKRPRRELDTVFVNSGIKDTLIQKIDWFLNNENWFKERGIIYKFCTLLHGIPGTGKTSLIFTLASYYGAELHIISKLDELKEVSNNVRHNSDKLSFVVIEDIDTMAANLNRGESEEIKVLKDRITDLEEDEPDEDPDVRASLRKQLAEDKQKLAIAEQKQKEVQAFGGSERGIVHQLLQTLDGFSTPWGMVVFITTNHVSKLDPAILRPGRVDLLLEIGPLGKQEMRRMFIQFYTEDDAYLIDAYINSVQFRPIEGAKLQGIFLSNTSQQAANILMGGQFDKQEAA